MTMTVRYSQDADTTNVLTVRVVGDKAIADFRKAIQRALNTWDQASPEIKEFGDMIDHRRVLQNYYPQVREQTAVKPE